MLTGPESTGKSHLAAHLARVFRVPCALEYAREYLERNGPAYEYALLRPMAMEHLVHQCACVPPASPVGVFDTDLLNYKIWCEVVFGRCHGAILDAIGREAHHVYLVCAPDLPWEPDPLRENPDNRDRLFDLHLGEIRRLGRPYRVVEGLGETRRQCAQEAFRGLTGMG